MSSSFVYLFAAALALAIAAGSARAEVSNKAPNFGSVANTRHNLTQSYLGGGAGWMSLSRNDYGEVCVYCHTPRGSNANVGLPPWSRTGRRAPSSRPSCAWPTPAARCA